MMKSTASVALKLKYNPEAFAHYDNGDELKRIRSIATTQQQLPQQQQQQQQLAPKSDVGKSTAASSTTAMVKPSAAGPISLVVCIVLYYMY